MEVIARSGSYEGTEDNIISMPLEIWIEGSEDSFRARAGDFVEVEISDGKGIRLQYF